jgi:fibronectin-binding autotransporter adhesin
VTAHADRDVLLGLSGGAGSIYSAKGKIGVAAGRDVILDNSSQITTDSESGNISVSAGRNLTIESTSGSKNTLIGTQYGGRISLSTAPGGIFTLDAGAGAQVSNFAPYNPGNITITSDDMVINDPIYDGKNTVTLQQAGTTARNIDLGSGTTPGDLDLSTAAISQITAQTLSIGRLNNPGAILVTAAVTTPLLGYGAPGTVELLSGSSIGSAAPGDTVTVPNLALQASSGIGTSSDPLETAVSVLSAKTATGGIFIDNNGNLSTGGGVIPKVTGIWDTASGDIQLENTGSVNILGGDFIIGPNDVSVAALGASSDIQTGGNGSIAARGSGTATVTAGRDLLAGGGSLGAGDIAGRNIVLSAGRDLIVNGGTSVHGADSLTAAVGRNITLSVPKDQIRTDAGPLTLTTGAGGVLTDNGSISSAFGSAGGTITLTAGDMAIAGSVDATTSTITLDVTGSGVVSGTITSFGLQKTGAGSLLVDGPNGSIIAPTTVDAGTLGGTGVVTRPVTTEPGATLAPGDNAPGILTTGRVALSSGSTFSVQLGGPMPGNAATNYGQLDANGNVSLNNATLAADLTFVPALAQTFTLIQATGNISGQFAQGMFVVLSGITYSINYLPHSVVLAAQADLSVSVSGPTSLIEGSTASYAYNVSDGGPGAAQNVVLSAPIPAGAVFVSASFGGAFSMLPASAYNASTGTADLGVLPAGAGGTLTLNVRLPEENTGIAWSATVASTTNDPNLADNSASLTTVVNDAPLTAQGHDVSSSLGAKTFTNVAVATFTDANLAATASDFTATVNWGDGTIGAAQIVANMNGTFSVIASHTYKDSKISSYSLAIQIVDVGGSTATVTGRALLRPVTRP